MLRRLKMKANLEGQSARNLNDARIGQNPAEPCRIDASRVSPCNTRAGIAKRWRVQDIDSIRAQLESSFTEWQLETLEERHIQPVEARPRHR